MYRYLPSVFSHLWRCCTGLPFTTHTADCVSQDTGVKIIPELDAPSHVGAGWDWGPLYGMGDLIICLDKQPWDEYCAQPPCGIFDPTNDKIADALQPEWCVQNDGSCIL